MKKILVLALLLTGCAATLNQAVYELRFETDFVNIKEKSYVLPWDCSGDYTSFRLKAQTQEGHPVDAVVCCHYFQGCYIEEYTVRNKYH